MVTSITPKTQRKRASKELYIGKKIAPKVIRTNKIDENGKLIDKEVAVYGRMIPILRFWKQIQHRDYERTTAADTLTQDDLRKIFLQLGEEMPNLVKKQRRTYKRLKTHVT